MTAYVDMKIANRVAKLVLTQPARLNAVSLAMWRQIPGLVRQALSNPDVAIIAITGAGEKAFCAGADISRFGDERTGAIAVAIYDAAVEQAENAIAAAGKPTIALINGVCYGGGLAIAMTCDLRLATAQARFCLPAARLGIGYAMAGVARLTQRLGLAATAEILFTARVFDAFEAKALGVVQRVFDPAAYIEETDRFLGGITNNAPLSLRAAKAALIELEKVPGKRHADTVQKAIAACYESADYAEAQAAFAQKRMPRFEGR